MNRTRSSGPWRETAGIVPGTAYGGSLGPEETTFATVVIQDDLVASLIGSDELAWEHVQPTDR